ncbi:hypothetical protein LJE86_12440 [bacterium BMS3Abin03]|nr:hypothetical protein [bacterium BMS3Abin03]
MKNLFKSTAILLFAVVVFSISTYGQNDDIATPKQSILDLAYKVCPKSLDSDIPGIVESSIYNVILLKKYYPSADYSNIIDKLNEISEKNVDPGIRFKAHLASMYLNFSSLIHVQPKSFPDYENEPEYIYKQITNQLESKLFVSNY